MEMKEIIVSSPAEWIIKLEVQCPHCEHLYDLTQYETMADLPAIRAYNDLELDTICPECSREFRIEEITT